MEDTLGGLQPNDEDEWYETTEALAQPLLSCYWSLWECGSGIVAEGDHIRLRSPVVLNIGNACIPFPANSPTCGRQFINLHDLCTFWLLRRWEERF